MDLRNQFLRSFELASLTQDPAERQRLLNFVIAGAGPTGVELSGCPVPDAGPRVARRLPGTWTPPR
ncbi:MAG: hypothetical protein WKG07_34950 [Hymenobacter sp.]